VQTVTGLRGSNEEKLAKNGYRFYSTCYSKIKDMASSLGKTVQSDVGNIGQAINTSPFMQGAAKSTKFIQDPNTPLHIQFLK